MNLKVPRKFRLLDETESFEVIRDNVAKGAVFHGTNLWILFFAILIASLGLNINSPAVVIGAMLISPLMGPILGIGLGVAINNLPLIKSAGKNYAFALIIGLVASTFYFLVSPLDQAHSEILARVSPSIYDVLIAMFGGFAGSIAISSKFKGNVIPGVAIATALMPPLCTAGYGLATLNMSYFFGALYLFIINSVFIGAATLITALLLKFPATTYRDPKVKRKESGIIWSLIILTILPSIYFGYDMVKQKKFSERAEIFIREEAHFPNDYLLKKEIDLQGRGIRLTFGGEPITETQINDLKGKLKYYGLEGVDLQILQGFAIVQQKHDPKLGLSSASQDVEWTRMQAKIDSIYSSQSLGRQVFSELRAIYPGLQEAVIQPVTIFNDTVPEIAGHLVLLHHHGEPVPDTIRLRKFLQERLQSRQIRLVVQNKL